jgi:hypothetical protein
VTYTDLHKLPGITSLATVSLPKAAAASHGPTMIGQDDTMKMTVDVLMSAWVQASKGDLKLILHSWVTYRDVFSNGVRRSEVAFQLQPALSWYAVCSHLGDEMDLVSWKPATAHQHVS